MSIITRTKEYLKNKTVSLATRAADGIASAAALSPKQIESIENARDSYLKRMPNPNEEHYQRLLKSLKVEVHQEYLKKIKEMYKPTPLAANNFDELNRIRYVYITRWANSTDENNVDNLASVYQGLITENCSVALVFHRSMEGTRATICVANNDFCQCDPAISAAFIERITGAIKGSFPGAEIQEGAGEELYGIGVPPDLNLNPSSRKVHSVACISNIASEWANADRERGIDKLLDNIIPQNKSEEYTLLLLATPVTDLDGMNERLNDFSSQLSDYASWQKNYSVSEMDSQNSYFSAGLNIGASFGTSTGNSVSVGNGVASAGKNRESSFGMDLGVNVNRASNISKQVGSSHGVVQTHTNADVQDALKEIETQKERYRSGNARGFWSFAAYVIAESSKITNNIAHNYQTLTLGDNSSIVTPSICTWDGQQEADDAKCILESLRKLQHPVFVLKDQTQLIYPVLVTPAVNETGKELALSMSFPKKSVAGLPVIDSVAFGRSISKLDNNPSNEKIEVGQIWHMGHADSRKADLDTSLLTSHVFITGSTGSGKSNAVYQLLNKLCKDDNRFLVIEPTKGEYKSVFGGREDVAVYGTNYKLAKLLRINPFSFPEGVQLYAHLDRLIEIFNACWPMYAAMPAVLKDAVERAYVDAGWDLRSSVNTKYGRLFPTFTDVMRQIDIVMNESEYSADSKSDYKGALRTRVNSLITGIEREIFTCDELSEADLFDRNVIVELSEIGSETTSLIMGILILKLQEYRIAAHEINAGLKHITVLEEAHNLLKRTSTEQTSEGANLTGKAVEMLTNAIAEMRTYGECFMIVDQSPGALDPAAIRNTNTKILLRLPDYSDREVAGKSIGLNEHQILELGKLEQGVAAVYQSGWIEAVLCKFDLYPHPDSIIPYVPEEQKMDDAAARLVNAVLFGTRFSEIANVIRHQRDSIVYKSSLPIAVKRKIWDACESSAIGKQELAGIAYELLEAETLFVEKKEPGQSEVAQQFRRMLRRYQLPDQAIKQADMVNLLELLRLEQRHRETNYVYGALMGGVR